jgi:hypothetical protein
MRASSFSLLAVVGFGACQHDHDVTLGTPGTIVKRIPADNGLDVLFVIDNSASTMDKQTVFASNFPTLAQALDTFPGGRPDLHIAVVSSTVDIGVVGISGCPHPALADDGRFITQARIATGCSAPTDNYIVDVSDHNGGRITNYSQPLPQTFSCMAQLGGTGCGFEAQLEAMKRALDGGHPENAGFLRPDADLAVIFLTDEDDCSVRDPSLFSLPGLPPTDYRCQPLYAYDCDHAIGMTPDSFHGCTPHVGGYLQDVSSYVQFLHSIKDRSQTFIGMIAGDPTPDITTGQLAMPFEQQIALMPSCSATINGNYAIGRPGLRLAELTHAYGDHGMFETVCQPDYSGVLADAGRTLFTMMSGCLEGTITATVDPRAGVVADCSVTDRVGFGTPSEIDSPVPHCAMLDAATPMPGLRPCYWMESTPAGCPSTPSHLTLHVERDVALPHGAVTDTVCCAP